MNVLFPWKVGQATGWGRYGLGLALALRRLGHGVTLRDGIASEAGPVLAAPHLIPRTVPGPSVVLHPVGNTFDPCPRHMVMPQSGFLQVALIVAEATTLTPPQIASLRTYDVLLAGCGWFRGVLAEHGLPSYRFPQGVDTLTFAPGRQRPPRTPNDPFLIFSGGKFEYRKGHDLVLESFKQLRRRFPEIPAKLVCAWHNAWPDTIGDLHHTGRLTSLPTFDPETKTWNFAAWLTTQRLDPADVMVCPPMFPEQMAAVVRECDAGLFLSRAEGNANMAMAEVLACGIPCLASGTTGHLEYLTEPLVTLASTWPTHRVPAGYAGAEGWGEVKPTEIAAYLAAMAKEAPDPSLHYARDFAETWGWDARAAALCEILAPMLP